MRPVSVELPEFVQRQDSGPTESFSEAPGAYGICSCSNAARVASYEASSAQASQPSPKMGVAELHTPGVHHSVLSPNLQPVIRPFLSRHAVVFTDASATGCGATYNRYAVPGLWMGPRLHCHINCLELLAVRLAPGRLKGLLHGKHVVICTDNTATVAYINRQGGLHSRRMWQLAHHLLLWSL